MPPKPIPPSPSRQAARRPLFERARRAETITRETFRLKALLLGDSGGGKSTSAMTLPGRKLVVELDGREESLAGFPDVEIIPIQEEDPNKPRAMDDLVRLKDELWEAARSPEGLPWDSLIVDGLTMLNRYAMNAALNLRDSKGRALTRGLGGAPAQHHYLPQMQYVTQFCMQLLPLPCHLCFTGHVDLYQDETDKSIHLYPKVTGKTRTEITSWFNETYLCERKKDRYVWRTAPYSRYTWLKSAANQLGRYWGSELEIDFGNPPTGFEHILNLRFGKETQA